jgi:arginine/lysine/histidine transporter system substrate-binding protein
VKFLKLVIAVVVVCVLFVFSLLLMRDNKKDDDQKILLVGISADYAPFEYFKEGKIVGFDIDLMNEIGKRLNKNVKFKDMSFDAILGSLTTKRLDAAISSIEPTAERRKSVDFSKNYITSGRVLVCKNNSCINTISDLTNKMIGVQSGSTHESYARDVLAKNVPITVKSLTRVPDLLQDMEIGNISCIILGTAEAESIEKARPNIKVVIIPGEVSSAAIAFPKGSSLTTEVDRILDQMEKDGSLRNLKKQWLPNDVTL